MYQEMLKHIKTLEKDAFGALQKPPYAKPRRYERERQEVAQCAARRRTQASEWLTNTKAAYKEHSHWLDLCGSELLDKRLQELKQRLRNIPLRGPFPLVRVLLFW